MSNTFVCANFCVTIGASVDDIFGAINAQRNESTRPQANHADYQCNEPCQGTRLVGGTSDLLGMTHMTVVAHRRFSKL